MPRSIDEWARDRNRSRGGSVGSSIVGAVGGKTGDGSISGSIVGAVGGQSGGSVGGSIAGAVQQQAGQSGGQGSPRSIEEWAQDQQGSRPQSLDAGQRLYEQRKQAQAEAKPWMKTLLWLGEMSNQAEQARLGQQIHPQENATTWEDVKDAWEASRKANRAADYAGRDKLIKEYNAARHEMGAQRHTPEPEVQRRYEQARDRLYEQERIHGNIGLNANGELQTMSYSFGEGVGNVIGGTMGRVIGGVGSAATWLGEAAARSEYAKSAANLREMAAFYAMAGNDNASEGAYRMADTLTQRAAQRGNLAEFGGAYDFFDKQAAAGNRLVQAAKENQRPVVQMGVDVGSTALEMGFDAVSGSPLVSMGVRVFGGSSQEAREAGAGFLQQGAYGAASASIEVMTEMIGGLKLYGGGQLDEVLEPALREVAGTPGGYALLRAMYTMVQEGNEEVLSDLLQPLAQSIYNGQSVGENYSQLELQDILYDWLLGAASAFGGAVVESGGYAQDYTAMREMQQDLSAQGVETGRMTDEQLRQAYTLDKAGVNVAGLQSAENRAVGGETIGKAYENMTQEQREAALVNMLRANEQRSEQTQTPTDNITRETAQEILRESLGEREAESAERILDLGSESNLREQAIAYHTIATEYGQTEGRSVEDALRSNVRGALNDTQVQHAYAYGESLRKSGQTVGVNGQTAEQGAQTANPVRRAGLVTAGTFADGNTTYKAADLSKADARDLRILNDIAKAQGVDFVLYESELGEADAEGRRSYIGANGAYRDGVVYLDINAGLTGERTEGGKTYSIGQRALLVTAAHELTHHLEHSNAAMYRQLRSFVTERLGGSDSFISYVRDAMAREDISVEAASREVVARACEEVLLDEDAIRELQGKKPTLWEQIKEWVKDFVKKFQSPSGEAVEMRQYADELRRLWLDTATQSAETSTEAAERKEAVSEANATQNAAPEAAYTGEITQYSLRGVEPVEPKSDAWKRGFTAEEVRRMYAGFRKSDAKNEYVEDSGKSYEERKAERMRLAQREKAGKRGNGTQRANTAPTYDRLYDTLEHEGFNGTILDASSGLGIGTDHGIQRGFDVEDIEPFYGEGYRPIFSDYSRLDKQYDVVISSAVINVLTQDDSDAMVTAIGKALKPGGRAFITVRSASAVDGSLKGGESKRLSQNAHEWVVPGSDNYQRGFETAELKAYLEDVLGPEYTVESSPKYYDKSTGKWQKWGDTSAVVTRNADEVDVQHSVRSDAMTDREILMQAAEEYGEEAELAEFRDAMARYQNYDETAQEHLQKLSELQKERKAVTDMRTSMGEITPQEKQQRLNALDKQIASERGKVSRAEKSAADALSRVTQLEKGRALQDILVKERAAQRQRTRDKASERLLKRDARKAVEKRAKVLYDMLMKNSDKQHVPEMLKEPLGAFLQGLDFSSNRLLNGGEETKRDAKFGAALQKISTMLNDQQAWINGDEKAKNGDFGAYLDISEENLTFLKDCSDLVTEALSENQTFTINQMSGKDLKALSGFLMNLTTAIRNMNNFMANARYESVREAAAADIEHMKALGRASERAGSGLSKTAMWDNGVPYYVLKRFGEGSKAIFDSIAKGWEKMAFNAKEIIDFTAEAYTTKEVNAWKREMHDFTLEDGSEIRMTTAQIMALSALIDREQATKHIEQGGIRIGDIKTAKGEIHDTTHYHLTAADISAIVGSLTERQAEVAGKLQKFMAKKGAEWGNEVSMKRFGYRFYTEGDAYYPIKTDSNDRPMADTDAQENSMFRLLNLSSSKSLNPKASNALIVDDIFDTFADHMADMAKLNGLGLPVLDAIKWFNYKERIDRGDGTYDTKTLQGAMEQAFGKEAQRYFSTLMKDINGVKESGDRGGEWQGKLISNYKVAAIGNSLRVMLLQPTSYVRALTLIKPRYLAGALFSKNAYKEALKYSGTAVWKALGYYDTNISRSMREQIQHSDSFGDQVKEVSMTGAEFGDKWTWGGLWVACKMQTRAEKGLSGEELNRATADLFRNVIYSSQVMDSTLTRSQSMRASGKFTKLKTAFMAEPTLSYNILLDAYSQTSLDMRKYGRSEGWKRNRGKMAHAFAVYAITASFSALVESFVDALRDDDDEELVDKFLDRLIGEVDKAGKRALLKGNLMQDLTIIGKIPELKDLISLFQGYGSRDMSVTALGELKDAYEVWRETILLQKGILDKATKTTYYGNMTLWGKIYKTLTALSHLSGYAVSNLTRDALSLWNTFVPSMKIKTYEGRGASAQAQRYIAAYRAGDRDKMREITESLGADRSGFNSQLSSEIRGDYLAGRITTAQANTMLTELRGLTKIEAQDKLREWDFEKTHGFAYEKLKEQFVEGNVSQAAAVRYIQEVKLKDLDDARNTVLKWQCVKETGIEYDDIKDRLQGGEISVQRAAAYWQKYGGMSAEDATLKANYVAACGATPGLADKLSQTQYKGWYNNVRSAGVKVEVYAEIRSTASTDGNSNVSQAEAAAAITRAIDARQLTPAQAQAVWQSFSGSWKTTYAEYIAQNK